MTITAVELESLAKKDPLAFGISYVDLLDGKQWSLLDRKWVKDLYKIANPFDIEKNPIGTARRVAFEKSTQAGISTLAITRMLHFAVFWPSRIGYMLPRTKDVSDFSATRLNPIINASDFLKSKRGEPDSVTTKKIGNSYLFLMEGTVEPRSMPMDALYLDEVDLCDPDNVGTALNRLDASNWRIVTYLSTPTLPNYGIDAIYDNSDRREWMVPCPHCGEKQPMDWEINLKIVGPESAPTSVAYVCCKCGRELTLQDIQEGEWVAQSPSKSKDMVGFHISQMMTTNADVLYATFRDPQQTTAEFYRKRLGKPYTFQGGSIEREDFLVNCFTEPYEFELFYDNESAYYMGVDQGNQLQVVVAKIPPHRRSPKIVDIELVPFDKGFERIEQLIKLYHVHRCIIDGDPNRHPVKDMCNKYPGRVLMADYIEQRERYIVKKDKYTRVSTNVNISRTDGFDDLVDSIKKGFWALPGTPPNLPPAVETLIDQVTSLKRDIEKRSSPSGERNVAVWRKLRADHLAHSMLYCKTAIDIDQGRGFKTQVIKPQDDQSEKSSDNLVAITALLAEVPVNQWVEYVQKKDQPDYTRPFPLSYKLGLAEAAYEQSEINAVIYLLVNSKI